MYFDPKFILDQSTLSTKTVWTILRSFCTNSTRLALFLCTLQYVRVLLFMTRNDKKYLHFMNMISGQDYSMTRENNDTTVCKPPIFKDKVGGVVVPCHYGTRIYSWEVQGCPSPGR